MTTLKAILFDLINQANASSDEVDNFDVDSNDPASTAAFNTLIKQQDDDCRRLVSFILGNAGGILAELADG